MKTRSLTLCAVVLASVMAGPAALAQPSGLRLAGGSKGIVLRDTESGLHLSFSAQAVPATTTWWNATDTPTPQDSNRNTLSADLPLDLGLHTSLGLSWDSGSIGAGKTANSAPSPFFGLGWNSEPSRSTRWALSATVGTHLTSAGTCKGALWSCGAVQPAGLSGNAMGNGLRLTPYVSFGATYSFDR